MVDPADRSSLVHAVDADRGCSDPVRVLVRQIRTLTADQRNAIRHAIDNERRLLLQGSKTSVSGDRAKRHSLADWCIDQAAGDPLMALALAISAHQTGVRLKATGRVAGGAEASRR